jgi:hypothetical protein
VHELILATNSLNDEFDGRLREEQSMSRYVSTNNAVGDASGKTEASIVRKAGEMVDEIDSERHSDNEDRLQYHPNNESFPTQENKELVQIMCRRRYRSKDRNQNCTSGNEQRATQRPPRERFAQYQCCTY